MLTPPCPLPLRIVFAFPGVPFDVPASVSVEPAADPP
jgi:hypothetical protein